MAIALEFDQLPLGTSTTGLRKKSGARFREYKLQIDSQLPRQLLLEPHLKLLEGNWHQFLHNPALSSATPADSRNLFLFLGGDCRVKIKASRQTNSFRSRRNFSATAHFSLSTKYSYSLQVDHPSRRFDILYFELEVPP